MSFGGTLDSEVVINLTVNDQATQKIASSTDKINSRFKAMKNEQRAVARQFELNNRTFVATARAIQSVGNIALRGVAVWQAYQIGQIRTANAVKNVRDAQRELNEAMISGDPEEIRKATEDLADANDELAKSISDANIGMLVNAVVVLGMMANIVKVIPKIGQMSHSFLGLRNSIKATNVQMSKFSSSGQPIGSTGKPATPTPKTPIGTPSNTKPTTPPASKTNANAPPKPTSTPSTPKGTTIKGGGGISAVGGKLGAIGLVAPFIEDAILMGLAGMGNEWAKQVLAAKKKEADDFFNTVNLQDKLMKGGKVTKTVENKSDNSLDVTITLNGKSETIHVPASSYTVE